MTKSHMAVDQYGQTFHGLKHPRKDLADRMGVTTQALQKIYVDDAEGNSRHCGYCASGCWFDIYEVTPINLKG